MAWRCENNGEIEAQWLAKSHNGGVEIVKPAAKIETRQAGVAARMAYGAAAKIQSLQNAGARRQLA